MSAREAGWAVVLSCGADESCPRVVSNCVSLWLRHAPASICGLRIYSDFCSSRSSGVSTSVQRAMAWSRAEVACPCKGGAIRWVVGWAALQNVADAAGDGMLMLQAVTIYGLPLAVEMSRRAISIYGLPFAVEMSRRALTRV